MRSGTAIERQILDFAENVSKVVRLLQVDRRCTCDCCTMLKLTPINLKVACLDCHTRPASWKLWKCVPLLLLSANLLLQALAYCWEPPTSQLSSLRRSCKRFSCPVQWVLLVTQPPCAEPLAILLHWWKWICSAPKLAWVTKMRSFYHWNFCQTPAVPVIHTFRLWESGLRTILD